jgi:hypothetical protein
MSSPFSTIEEFEAAIDGPTGGAIYTFAHMPVVNAIALLIAVGLFIWFVICTFSTRYEESSGERSVQNLTMLILAGLLSLVGVEHPQNQTQTHATTHQMPQATAMRQSRQNPVGWLGLVGLGGARLRRSAHRKGRNRRRISRINRMKR